MFPPEDCVDHVRRRDEAGSAEEKGPSPVLSLLVVNGRWELQEVQSCAFQGSGLPHCPVPHAPGLPELPPW